MPRSKYGVARICEYCNQPFIAKQVVTRFCSPSCNEKYNREQKKKQREEERQIAILKEKRVKIAEIQTRPYISIREAVSLYGVSKETIRRWILQNRISAVNPGKRLTRINRSEMDNIFSQAEIHKETQAPLFSANDLNKEDCYTINEILEQFNVTDSTLRHTIRRFDIPRKQIGKYVYVPKKEIEKIFQHRNIDL